MNSNASPPLNNTAVGTEIVGIVGLAVLLVVVGAVRGLLQPAHLFSTGSAPSPWFGSGTLTTASPFQLSFLLGAFTIVGFEAAANLAEETQDAHRTVPAAMWFSILLSGVVGFAFLIALNLASQDIAGLIYLVWMLVRRPEVLRTAPLEGELDFTAS